jgi:predicted ATPase
VIADAPVLLLCLARSELRETRPEFGKDSSPEATELTIGPLDSLESHRLMENLLGEASLPEVLEERITQAAQGNPLFVEEMLRGLVDEGRLERQDGSWRAVDELSEVQVPATSRRCSPPASTALTSRSAA